MSTTTSDLYQILTQSKRIISAHSRHFLSLSLLFLLPLSFSLTFFPTLFNTFTSSTPNHIVSLLRLSSKPLLYYPHHQKTLTFSLLFSSFISFFSLLAFASVSYSVFHGFYGRPVKILSSITSLFSSFLPLLATFMIAQIVVFFIFVVFGVFGFLGVKFFELIFVGFGYNSVLFVVWCLVLGVLLMVVLVYVSVDWCLLGVIVVVEGKWGFEPMSRSKGLMRGMRWVGLCLIMFFGFFASVLLWLSMVLGGDQDSGLVNDGWGGWGIWAFVLRTVVTCAVLTLILLHSIASTTVLYMYCKALHGELAGEIASEFAAEYVSLPFDDKKVPHIVYHVQ